MRKIIFILLLLVSHNSYCEVISLTCIIKFTGGKQDEYNFTFLTPPNSKSSKVLNDGKEIVEHNWTNGNTTHRMFLKDLSIHENKISWVEMNQEIYTPPIVRNNFTYDSSDVNFYFDISRVTGKFTLSEYRKGLQQSVSPGPTVYNGQCEKTIKKF